MSKSSKRKEGRAGDGLYKKRGFWYYTVVDWMGKRHALSTRTKSYKEALRKKGTHLDDINKGVIDPTSNSGRISFRDAAAAWLPRAVIGLDPGTIRHYRRNIAKANEILGDLPIASINPKTLKQYQVNRTENGASPGYINNETNRIASVLADHHLWARIRPEFKRLKVTETAGRSLEDGETLRLLTAIEEVSVPEYVPPMTEIFYGTGMRHKELRTMRRRGIDLANNRFVVDRRSTKTPAGKRFFPMTDLTRQAAEQLLALAESKGSVRPNHFLFPGFPRRGRRVPDPTKPISTFDKALQRLRMLAGLDPTLRIHDLRHNYTTDMAETNTSTRTAMDQMGWRDPAMRTKYEHMQLSRMDAARESVEQVARVRARRGLLDRRNQPAVIRLKLRQKAN